MNKTITRRETLKTLGLVTIGGFLSKYAFADVIEKKYTYDLSSYPKPGRVITAIVLGAGNRGNVYGNYALEHPDELKIIGVAEPIPIRIERFTDKHRIDADSQFKTWEDVFKRQKFADAIIITTPDALHYGCAMQALMMGYDVLLEKPIAQTWDHCWDIHEQAEKYDRIVAVCHVLRYAPYYIKIKEIVDSGVLGKLISIQHMEPIQHEHMSHSYVRGNWRREDESTPILLAKSCHDLDILKWWTGKSCRQVASFGSLTWFKNNNAPEGSTMRCTDGCQVEQMCPYSALKIYYRNRSYLHHFDLPDNQDRWGEAIMDNLKTGPYGRCVYHCDNDVPDHQIVSMVFEDDMTINFNMEAFTNYAGRRTRIMGSMGDLVGDEIDLYVADFRKDEITKWNVNENAQITSGHGGGDYGLVRDWLKAVEMHDPTILTSSLAASMESHLIGFRAEESRHNGTIVKVEMPGG
jgi:predicted dehydrogenase